MKLIHPIEHSNITNSSSGPGGAIFLNVLLTSRPENGTTSVQHSRGSAEALMYIIVVLFFYSFCLGILMVKYIRREKEEADLRQYYHEFVSRERFNSALFQNKVFMKNVLNTAAPDTPKSYPINDVGFKVSFSTKDDSVVEKLLPSRQETPV